MMNEADFGEVSLDKIKKYCRVSRGLTKYSRSFLIFSFVHRGNIEHVFAVTDFYPLAIPLNPRFSPGSPSVSLRSLLYRR